MRLKADTWSRAFVEAEALLASEQLTAVAAMSASTYHQGGFPVKHLAGTDDPWETFANLQEAFIEAHEEDLPVELWHGEYSYSHDGTLISGWLLVFVFPG